MSELSDDEPRGRSWWLKPYHFQPGQSGNPGGRPRGLTRIIRDLLTQRTLCGKELPDGRTVEEMLAEAILAKAIEGSPVHLAQIWDRLEGKAGLAGALEDGLRRTIFEIIDNHRDDPPPVEGTEGDEPITSADTTSLD